MKGEKMSNEISTSTNNKEILRVHNSFINAIFSLSADAKKLLLLIWLHTNDNGKNIEIYRQDIIEKVGIDLKNLNPEHREKIVDELMKSIITIRDADNPSNFTKIQLVYKTRYENGILYTNIDEDLLKYIKEAREKLFTRFKIQNIKPLTSSHAIRIYLLLKQFEDTGWRKMKFEEFRKILDLEYKYPRTWDLKKYVLEVAKKQINENTDIEIDYELEKKGRQYTHIKFTIKSKEKENSQDNNILQEKNNTKTETKNQLPAPTQNTQNTQNTHNNDKLKQLAERLKNSNSLKEFRKHILNFGENLILILSWKDGKKYIYEIIEGLLGDYYNGTFNKTDALKEWGDVFDNRKNIEIYLRKDFNFDKFKLRVKKEKLAKFIKSVEKLNKEYNIFPLLLSYPRITIEGSMDNIYAVDIVRDFKVYEKWKKELINNDNFLFIVQKIGSNKRYYIEYNKDEFLKDVNNKIKEMQEQEKNKN